MQDSDRQPALYKRTQLALLAGAAVSLIAAWIQPSPLVFVVVLSLTQFAVWLVAFTSWIKIEPEPAARESTVAARSQHTAREFDCHDDQHDALDGHLYVGGSGAELFHPDGEQASRGEGACQ